MLFEAELLDSIKAVESFTLIKLFLNVVLVCFVPADAIQPLSGQTCKHKHITEHTWPSGRIRWGIHRESICKQSKVQISQK